MSPRLPVLTVVEPCPLAWEDMAGNDRVRFCGHCRQHVYDVASLTMTEVMALIQEREGRACVRLQRRADGTVITRDCLHVVRRARERLVATALGLGSMAVGFWSGVGMLRRFLTSRAAAPPTPSPPSCPPPPPAAPAVTSDPMEPVPPSTPPTKPKAPKPLPPRVGRLRVVHAAEELGLVQLKL